MNIPELTWGSDTIVIGAVRKRMRSRRDKSEPEVTKIYNNIVIEVEEYRKNPLDQREVNVSLLGGTVGNITMEVMDEAYLEPK